jgi:hypothetical protein
MYVEEANVGEWKEVDEKSAKPRVKIQTWDDDEGELGDSFCFGTRTVETIDFGLDCVWKLHGGV